MRKSHFFFCCWSQMIIFINWKKIITFTMMFFSQLNSQQITWIKISLDFFFHSMNLLYTSSVQSSSLFSWIKKTGWAHSAAKWATTRHTSYFRHVDAMIFIWWCGSWGKLSRITIRVDHSAPEPGYNGATPPYQFFCPIGR